MSLYVYGIVREETSLPALEGVQGQKIATLGAEGHAAVVSQVDDPDALGVPDDLLAHSRVLDGIAAGSAVLPLVFGTVVPDEETVLEEVLLSRHGAYEDAFGRVGDAVQFSLRGRFDRDAVLTELVSEQPEIAALRRATSGRSEMETRDERIRLGELVVRGLQEKAEAEAPMIRAALEPLAREIVDLESAQAEDVVNLAALVERGRQAAFETAAEELARKAAGRISFRLVGPQAPYDFAGGS